MGGTGSSTVDIFDRDVKRAHRERAVRLQTSEDPLQAEVAERLLDRLEDCKRTFPRVAVLGGAGEAVVSRLCGGRAGIESAVLLDSSNAMLERCRQRVSQQSASTGPPGLSNLKVEYVEGEEDALPLKERSMDLIVSCLGLHWVNDLPGAMIQCQKALKPDGLFLGAMFGGDTLQELRIAHGLAEQEVEGGISPRISPLAQVRDAGNLLTRANLAIPSVDTDEIIVNYRSMDELVRHLRAMGESNAVRVRRPLMRLATARRAAEIYAEKFGTEDGALPATYQIIFMTGWAPHASQQRPMQRGSAEVTLESLQAELAKRKASNPKA
ncbi:g12583 [Coccomyxa viridis]|uniref:G12583 protein n=1 Tax=Coccomyxa viridis TaxID=1274662 RepID=A0ABP1GEU3_9CHLO